jgi:hypothetical protein
MQTLSKRTFPHYDNVTLELYKRNDGTHRIKYTDPSGHELVFNVSAATSKSIPEDEFEWMIRNIENEWSQNREKYQGSDRYNCNIHEFQWIVVAQMLSYISGTFAGGARHFANRMSPVGSSLGNTSSDEKEPTPLDGISNLHLGKPE